MDSSKSFQGKKMKTAVDVKSLNTLHLMETTMMMSGSNSVVESRLPKSGVEGATKNFQHFPNHTTSPKLTEHDASRRNWTALWAATFVLFILPIFGCGGASKFNPVDPPTVEAAEPPFPPAQKLTCDGDYLSPAGMICDESDGSTFYNHYHWSVSVRPDGHGTFQISTEQGIRKGGLYQIAAPFPYIINIVELHPTLSVNSYCSGNGFESKWDGSGVNTIEHLIGSKAFRIDASGISQDFPVSQVVYPQPVPVSNLILYTFTDLCSVSTLHWTVTGSF